jgi:hypothetical protein
MEIMSVNSVNRLVFIKDCAFCGNGSAILYCGMPGESRNCDANGNSRCLNTTVARKWLSSHQVMAPTDTHATIEVLLEAVFSVQSVPSLYNEDYLPMSQIWESKVWSRVPRDSDPRKTTLARASSIYKRQTRPLDREGALQKQDYNCQRVINIWSWAPDGARHQDLLIDWPSVAMWLYKGDFWDGS